MDAQMFPMLHWEKCISPVSATGLMINCEFASHVDVVSGQQVIESVSHPLLHEHPLAHCHNREHPYTYTNQYLASAEQRTHVVLRDNKVRCVEKLQ